jgi:hypothetical protein
VLEEGEGAGTARGALDGVDRGATETARGETEGRAGTARGGTEGVAGGGAETARGATEGVARGATDAARGGAEGVTCRGTETARGGTDGVAIAPGAVRAVVGSFGARGSWGDRRAATVSASDVSDGQSESIASVGGADGAPGAIEAEATTARGLLRDVLPGGIEAARGAVEGVTAAGREERTSGALAARLVTTGPTEAAGLGSAGSPGFGAGRRPVACATVGSLGAGGTTGDRSAAAVSVSEVSEAQSESIVSVGGTMERGVTTIVDVDRLSGRDEGRSGRSLGFWGSRVVLIAFRHAHLNPEDERHGTRFHPDSATPTAATLGPDWTRLPSEIAWFSWKTRPRRGWGKVGS